MSTAYNSSSQNFALTNLQGKLVGVNGTTSAFDMSSQKITSLATPTASTDAATKQYVDDNAGGGSIGLSNLDTDLGDIVDYILGSTLDPFALTVTSDGATVTLNLEQEGGGDIRLYFEDGIETLDTTPAATVTLTAGTDTAPTLNYVYIPDDTRVLTVSTSGWDDTQMIVHIATVLVPSATLVQSDGAYKVHAWEDHSSRTNGMGGICGHGTHINEWIRQQNASWVSGCALTPTVGASTFDIATATGVVYQVHPKSMPAFDTSTGSVVYIINHPDTPYRAATDLTQTFVDKDINGTVLGGGSSDFYNLVIWGVASQNSGDSKLFCNLPDGVYANDSNSTAANDVNKTAVYDIPTDYRGTGFLIARLTVQENAGTYTIVRNTDLRGTLPSTDPGSVGGATTNLESVLMTGNGAGSYQIDMNSNKIVNVADPTANQDAATKKYVDDNTGAATDLTTTQDTFNVDGRTRYDFSHDLLTMGSGMSSWTSASHCTGFGFDALNSMTSGTYNTGVGCDALEAMTTSSNNTGVGAHALNSFTGASGDNTAVGAFAGTTLTSGNNNVFLGSGADVSSGGISNAIAIGYSTVANASTAVFMDITRTTVSAANLYLDGGDQEILRSTSSARAKEEIVDAPAGSLDKLMQLQHRQFKWKAETTYKRDDYEEEEVEIEGNMEKRRKKDKDGKLIKKKEPKVITSTIKEAGRVDCGFIAEEVNAVDPLMAPMDKYGEVNDVDIRQMLFCAVAAVQELAAKVEALEKK
jgi:hypothetical protein